MRYSDINWVELELSWNHINYILQVLYSTWQLVVNTEVVWPTVVRPTSEWGTAENYDLYILMMKYMYVWIASRPGLRCFLRCFKSFWQVNNVVDMQYHLFAFYIRVSHKKWTLSQEGHLGPHVSHKKWALFKLCQSRKMSTILSDDDDDGDSHGDDDDGDDDDGCRNNFQVGNCWKAWSGKSTMWYCYWTLFYERSTFCLIGTCLQLTCQWSDFLRKKFYKSKNL